MGELPNNAMHTDCAITLRFESGITVAESVMANRSSTPRAPGAKLKSRRDDLIIAQGKRGTSAALGYGRKMTSSFFLPVWRAKPEGKKSLGGVTFYRSR